MPPAQRRHAAGVIEQLLREPQRFGFFQAVRLLDRWLADASPDGPGGLSKLNFRNSLSLSFPASEIESLLVHRRVPQGAVPSPGEPGDVLARMLSDAAPQAHPTQPGEVERIDLTPAFMGLLGVNGTLPLFYTEMLAQRELYQKDLAARAFMDVFSHRAVSMFYQAWRKHRLPLQFEVDQRNRFLPLVLSIAGVGQKSLRDRLGPHEGGVADEALAYYAGALQQRRVSAGQLQPLLRHYLGVPVRIEQFVGRWYQLPEEGRFHLGRASGGAGLPNGVLGRSAMLGERVWQRDLRIRVVLGPLDQARFRRFLPGGAGAKALKSWLTMLSGVSLEYEINLQLMRQAVQGVTLDAGRDASAGCLGWNTFLQTRPAHADRVDVHYDIHATA